MGSSDRRVHERGSRIASLPLRAAERARITERTSVTDEVLGLSEPILREAVCELERNLAGIMRKRARRSEGEREPGSRTAKVEEILAFPYAADEDEKERRSARDRARLESPAAI